MGLYAQDQLVDGPPYRQPGRPHGLHEGEHPGAGRPGHHLGRRAPLRRGRQHAELEGHRSRVGVYYDVFGNGNTAIKANVEPLRHHQQHRLRSSEQSDVHVINSTTRPWTDSNSDFIPQWTAGCTYASAGCELGPLSNANFGLSNPAAAVYDPSLSVGWGVRPGNWEVTAGVQHELLPRVGVEVTYFRRAYFNFYATQNQAYSPSDYDAFSVTTPSDPRLPGGGNQVLSGFYDLKPTVQYGLSKLHTYNYDKFGDGSETFQGVDFQATARLGGSTFFTGGFSTGRLAYSFCADNFVGQVLPLLPQLPDCGRKRRSRPRRSTCRTTGSAM